MLQIPFRFRRHDSGGATTLSWSWRNGWLVPGVLTFWLIFWWSFIYRTEGRAIAIEARKNPELTLKEIWMEKLVSIDWWWSLFPFPLLQIVIGSVMIYILLAQLFNRTTLTIHAGKITLAHRPFPWKTPKALKLSEVRTFLADTITVSRRRKGSITSHLLVARLHNNQRLPFVKMRHWQAKHEIAYLVEELNSRI